jgi:hypothetical protein
MHEDIALGVGRLIMAAKLRSHSPSARKAANSPGRSVSVSHIAIMAIVYCVQVVKLLAKIRFGITMRKKIILWDALSRIHQVQLSQRCRLDRAIQEIQRITGCTTPQPSISKL